MLRLRHAIERASGHRWLWMLVVLFLAVLLVLVALQAGVEEALLGPSIAFTLALIVVATVAVGAPRPAAIRMRSLPLERGPPDPPGHR